PRARVSDLAGDARRSNAGGGPEGEPTGERPAGEELPPFLAVAALEPHRDDAGLAGTPRVLPRRRLLGGQQLLVVADHIARRAVVGDLTRPQEDRPLTDALDGGGGMRDEHDRSAPLAELENLAEALALERLVADREDLVEEQDVGVEVGCDREAEPHVHPRRVRPNRDVEEIVELGEGDDLVDPLANVRTAEAVDRAVHVDVLPA